MKVLRKSCWLLLWKTFRIDSRTDFEHLRFPEFVGTLPSKVGEATVRMILPPLLLAYAPLPAETKIQYGKSLCSGQPKIERGPNEVICRLGRMILVAERVENLSVIENDNETETLNWTQLRKIMYDKVTGDEIEVTPERPRAMTIKRRTGAIA